LDRDRPGDVGYSLLPFIEIIDGMRYSLSRPGDIGSDMPILIDMDMRNEPDRDGPLDTDDAEKDDCRLGVWI
jgi:hypothetical protein